jgi:hypothetical protein
MQSSGFNKNGDDAMFKMKSFMKPLLCAGAFCLLTFATAGAKPADRGPTPGLGWGPGGSKGGGYAVPGPVAGVGLPILVAAGGYLWVRRRIRKDK